MGGADVDSVISGIRETIQSLVPGDELEANDRHSVLEWLRMSSDVFRRVKPAIPHKHLAVYCVPVDLSKEKLFMGHHLSADRWLPPGGHVDPGEDPANAALREIREELGISASLFPDESPLLISVDATVGKSERHIDVTLWYACAANADDTLRLTAEEFSTSSWIRFSDVGMMNTNENLGRFIRKLISARTAS